jgi:hypothetical protein
LKGITMTAVATFPDTPGLLRNANTNLHSDGLFAEQENLPIDGSGPVKFVPDTNERSPLISPMMAIGYRPISGATYNLPGRGLVPVVRLNSADFRYLNVEGALYDKTAAP